MKLKNSYILLIVMSIFLLISIGSVCANDVSDAQLADDGSDVIAVDNGESIVSDDEANTTPEKIDTSVVSEDVRINEGDPANIDVTVNDNESNPIVIEKANLTVTEANNNINFDYNNSVITILDNLAAGNHSLVINYLGNDNYANSSTNITLSVVGNYTMNVPDSINVNGTKMVVVPIEITNSVDIYEINKNKLTLVLTYTQNNETITKPINDFELENGTIIFDYTVNVITSTLAIDYTDDTLSFTQNTTVNRKFDTTVISEDVRVNEGEVANITVTVIDDELNVLDIEKGNITILEGNNTINFEYNNTVITILDNLAAGNHSLVITYLGNDLCTNSSTNITLSVVGNYSINVPASVNVNSTNITVIPIEITNGVDVYEINKNNLTLVLSYTQDNETINQTIDNFELENGTIKFDYHGNNTPITLFIDYTDDTLSLTQNTTINRIINAKIIILNTEAEYRSGNFTFLLVDVDNNNTPVANKKLKYTILTGSINTAGTITTDENGTALIDNRFLTIYVMDGSSIEGKAIPVGKQLFSLESDDSSVVCEKIENNFTITKVTIKIVINPYNEYFGSGKQVSINVTNAKTGLGMYGIILDLYIKELNQTLYLMTDVNGSCGISVFNSTSYTGLVGGTYNLVLSNNDTENIENTTTNGSITIKPIPIKLEVSGTTNYYNTGNSAKIKVINKLTGKAAPYAYLMIQIDGKSYLMQANKKGIIEVAASLAVGKHKMKVIPADKRYTGSSVTKTITVKKATAKITAPKVTAYYKQGKYFTVKVTNTKNKKPIYDAKVNIKIFVTSTSYYNYNGNTGLNGQLKLLIDLKPGTYKVVVKGNDNKDFTANQVTSQIIVKKAPTKLYPTKLIAKKGDNKKFKVTVKNTKTKKIISGVKVTLKVYTGKTYKTYTVKTNSKGIAQLNVKSLSVGTHKVVVSSADKYCTAKTAKSSIKITKK